MGFPGAVSDGEGWAFPSAGLARGDNSGDEGKEPVRREGRTDTRLVQAMNTDEIVVIEQDDSGREHPTSKAIVEREVSQAGVESVLEDPKKRRKMERTACCTALCAIALDEMSGSRRELFKAKLDTIDEEAETSFGEAINATERDNISLVNMVVDDTSDEEIEELIKAEGKLIRQKPVQIGDADLAAVGAAVEKEYRAANSSPDADNPLLAALPPAFTTVEFYHV